LYLYEHRDRLGNSPTEIAEVLTEVTDEQQEASAASRRR
jgi:hypothetical protein